VRHNLNSPLRGESQFVHDAHHPPIVGKKCRRPQARRPPAQGPRKPGTRPAKDFLGLSSVVRLALRGAGDFTQSRARCRDYLPRITSMPAKINCSFARGSFPTQSFSASRPNVTSCETFATESWGSPVIRAPRSAFRGASVHRRLLVRGTQSTVAIRLRFRTSPWMTMTGRRYPAQDPAGAGRSAQRTSPCESPFASFK
jgi:hypothetical protein